MNIEEAVKVLEQGLNIASKQGSFNLKDAKVLQDAIDGVINYVNMHESTKEMPVVEAEEVKSKK